MCDLYIHTHTRECSDKQTRFPVKVVNGKCVKDAVLKARVKISLKYFDTQNQF